MNKFEFGSDFHYIKPATGTRENTLALLYPSAQYYALGRHCLLQILQSNSWSRIWVPNYYCFEVIEYIKENSTIEICFYEIDPMAPINIDELKKNTFEAKDVILVVNYFGLHSYNDFSEFPITVIEDHTHDILGSWATQSQADWCFASLRKCLPISEGGMVWSPAGYVLGSDNVQMNADAVFERRQLAMLLKKEYLNNNFFNKDLFRELFVETESIYENLPISGLSSFSKDYLARFDVVTFLNNKKKNFEYALSYLTNMMDDVEIMKPVFSDNSYPLSLIIRFTDKKERDQVRKELIEKRIYSAVLWPLPACCKNINSLSDQMLSIHCDSRYNTAEIHYLCVIIKDVIENVRGNCN